MSGAADTPKKAKSPEVLKQLRKSAKGNLTRLLHKIEAKIKSRSSSEAISLLRENLTEQKDQVLTYHTKYVDAAGLNEEQRDDADAWAQRVDDAAVEAYKAIDEYLEGLAQTEPNSHPEQDNAPVTVADRLEAKRKRQAAEEALQEIEKEVDEYVRQANEKRKRLESDLRQKRLEETLLERSVNTTTPPSPVPLRTSTPAPNSNTWNDGAGPSGRTPNQNQGYRCPDHTAPTWLSGLLPKIELPIFNGDPRLWRSFSRSFRELVHDTSPSDAQRIVVLRQMLAPDVRYGLEQMLRNPDHYGKVWQELQEKYGNKYVVSRAYLRSLQHLRSCKDGDNSALRELAARLHDVVCGLQDEDCVNMCSGSSLELVIDKLPTELRSKWEMHAFKKKSEMPTLIDLDAWLQQKMVGRNWHRPIYESREARSSSRRNDIPSVLATSTPALQDEEKGKTYKSPRKDEGRDHNPKSIISNPPCQLCGTAGHPLYECGRFIIASPTERVKMVMQEGNCFRCLGRQHMSVDCKKNVSCSINGCNRKHHPLLHGGAMPSDVIGRKPTNTPRLTGANAESCCSTQVRTGRKQLVLLPITLVTIRHLDKSQQVLALLDSGSQVSLVHKDLAEKLNMRGKKEKIRLSTFHGSDPDINVTKTSFDLLCGETSLAATSDALVVPYLNVASCPIDWSKEKENWSHLADLSLPSTHSQPVLALIGMDVPEAHIVIETRAPENKRRGPYAQRTILGWVVIGCFPRTQAVATLSCYTQSLDELLKNFFEVDVYAQPTFSHPNILNVKDRRAMDILKNTTRCYEGRYEVGLLWCEDKFSIPDNRPIAMQRLFANEQRFKEDPDHAEQYSQIINEYIRLGFARKLTIKELQGPPGRTHYLVHFSIKNPNKPGKLRVVFHASLKYKGVALNDLLMSGPDLLTNLVGILIRFRTSAIAVSGDIEKMFHQVGVPLADQTMLRFLWREPNSNHPPQTYQMCRQIFGAASSPTCCTWALRQAAEDQPEFDLREKIVNNFYVDNYLDSFDQEEDAITQCHKMIEMLKNKGFRLNQWCSSSRSVLNSIPTSEWSNPNSDGESERLPVERTLGMYWDCEMDSLIFHFKDPETVTTKREMFSAAATIFDPLGCIGPVVLPVKVIMQDVWRAGIRWDQQLPETFLKLWRQWCNNLKDLVKLRIPRCFRPADFNKENCKIQLHVFSDASKDAYGAVGYLRYEKNDSNKIHVAFVLGKTRVAPVRKQTIPKLELNGASLAVEVARIVMREFEQTIDCVTYWTDSTTVLHWINSPNARQPEFVANRVSHILTNSNASQWNHVPGTLNAADDCSRGLKAAQLDNSHRWLSGPSFLQDPPNYWPSQKTWRLQREELPEIEECTGVYAISSPETHWEKEIEAATQQATTLEELKDTVTKLIFDNRKTQVTNLRDAMTECVRSAQKAHFKEDIRRLTSGEQIHKTSRIVSLNPYLDEDGLLRVGGRLEHAEMDEAARFPLIIPHDHPLAKLIILDTHEMVRHAGKVRTLAEVRGRYWITRGLAAVGKCIRSCITCCQARAKATPPRMAPLPAHRLMSHVRAFTNIGIDYFGPSHVVVGRHQEKRYGVLFTCLSTRAVHLELAHPLTSDSFILAFRRFVNRRGAPSVIYSDNGTNLTAGEKEMRAAIEEINVKLKVTAEKREIEWYFSPPSAPHFGGVWERLVRCCKSALAHVLHGQTVSDEILHTALTEVESLLNGRPLTHVSIDPRDPTPLTPNHFLLGGPHPNLPIAVISPKERLSSKSWRRAQQITDHFWKRWLSEYVPNLTERIKWTRKERALRVGDLVLVADKASERGTWPVGRVTKVMPGKDGIVRTAVVKTQFGEYTRPVIKLFVFRESEESQAPEA